MEEGWDLCSAQKLIIFSSHHCFLGVPAPEKQLQVTWVSARVPDKDAVDYRRLQRGSQQTSWGGRSREEVRHVADEGLRNGHLWHEAEWELFSKDLSFSGGEELTFWFYLQFLVCFPGHYLQKQPYTSWFSVLWAPVLELEPEHDWFKVRSAHHPGGVVGFNPQLGHTSLEMESKPLYMTC